VSLWDKGTVFGTEIIGRSAFELDNRVFSKQWQVGAARPRCSALT
jgi:hypothetical protein